MYSTALCSDIMATNSTNHKEEKWRRMLRESKENFDVVSIDSSHILRFKFYCLSNFAKNRGHSLDLGGFQEVVGVRYFGFGGAHIDRLRGKVKRCTQRADLVWPTIVVIL